MAATGIESRLTGEPLRQPDIEYIPNYEKYLARVKRRIENEALQKTLPSGFPKRLDGDLVWDGRDIAEKYDWVYELSTNEIEEIEQGLKHFKGLSS
jgi:hypothetical protein